MSYLFVLLLLLYVIGNQCYPERIFRGQSCTVEDHPFVVSLRDSENGEHFSSGTLIKEAWVLTAALTTVKFDHNKPQIVVLAGISDSTLSKSDQMSKAEKLYFHEKYNDKSAEYDLALIELKKPLVLGRKVALVNLPKRFQRNLLLICLTGTVMGWGETFTGAKDSPVNFNRNLLCTHVTLIDNVQCAKMFSLPGIVDGVMCTFNNDADPCPGDEGGPLLCGNVQYGIITEPTCNVSAPSVYTRVDHYLNFINRAMGKFTNSTAAAEIKPNMVFMVLLLGCFLLKLK